MITLLKSAALTGLLAVTGVGIAWNGPPAGLPVSTAAQVEPADPPVDPLTPEERTALREFLRGRRRAILAETLGLSVEALDEALAAGQTPAALVEAAGLTPAELRAGLRAGWADALEEAEAAGLLDAEQADHLREHGGRLVRRRLANRPAVQRALAEALALTPEELAAARAEGATVPDLIDSLGLEREEVAASLQLAYARAITRAVEGGRLTPAQGARLLARGWRPGRPPPIWPFAGALDAGHAPSE